MSFSRTVMSTIFIRRRELSGVVSLIRGRCKAVAREGIRGSEANPKFVVLQVQFDAFNVGHNTFNLDLLTFPEIKKIKMFMYLTPV